MSLKLRKRVLEVNRGLPAPSATWIDVCAPKKTSDLAVNHQKVDSVKQWLKFCRPNKSSFLLLTGPPGCGKTACIRVLAEELGFQLHEWVTPPDDEYSKENYQSQKDKFYEFLFKASRYQSLFNQKPRLLLVEDFPTIWLDQKAVFPEVLQRYKEVGKSPLIFIATETRSLNVVHKLFPNDVQAQFAVHNIQFNSIAATLMKKALQSLLGNLKAQPGFHSRFTEPTADVLDSLIVSSQGDIRNAILNLQFVSQKSEELIIIQILLFFLSLFLQPLISDLPRVAVVKVEEVSNKDVNNTRAKRKKDTNKLKEIGCDESLSTMHGLGRVFNPKYDPVTTRLTHCPETLTDLFGTLPSHFIHMLFANYLSHFSSVIDSVECVDSFSKSDYFLTEYRDLALAQFALTVGIRGAMVANRTPVSGWIPVKGYKQDGSREAAVQEDYNKFIGGSSSSMGQRNLVSKNTFIMDFMGSLGKIKGQSIRGVGSSRTENLEQEELDLIQQIETMDSD